MFLFGKKRKERKQFEYFSKCAEMGIPEAMYNLFMCYHAEKQALLEKLMQET